VKDEPALKEDFSHILELAFKLAHENPLNESHLEPCEPLSLTVGGLEAANEVKIMMAGSLVKQAQALISRETVSAEANVQVKRTQTFELKAAVTKVIMTARGWRLRKVGRMQTRQFKPRWRKPMNGASSRQ